MPFVKVEGHNLISYELTHRKKGPSYQFRTKIKDGDAPYIRKRFDNFDQGLEWAEEQLRSVIKGTAPRSKADFAVAFELFMASDHAKRIRSISSLDETKQDRKAIRVDKRTKAKHHWFERVNRDLVNTDMSTLKFVKEVNEIVAGLKCEMTGKLLGKDLSTSTKKSIMIVVRQIMNFSFERGHIHRNLKYELDTYSDPEEAVPTFTVPQIRHLMSEEVIFDGLQNHRIAINAIKEYIHPKTASRVLGRDKSWCGRWMNPDKVVMNPYWALTALMVYTGMRPIECNDLKWEHVDMVGMVFGVSTGKGMKDRNVPIMAEFLPLLDIIRKATGDTEYVLPAKVRNQVDSNRSESWRKWITNHMELTPGARLYSCRHTYAALLVAMGKSDIECMLWMGHKEKLTTLHYANQAQAYKVWVRGWGEEFQMLTKEE